MLENKFNLLLFLDCLLKNRVQIYCVEKFDYTFTSLILQDIDFDCKFIWQSIAIYIPRELLDKIPHFWKNVELISVQD